MVGNERQHDNGGSRYRRRAEVDHKQTASGAPTTSHANTWKHEDTAELPPASAPQPPVFLSMYHSQVYFSFARIILLCMAACRSLAYEEGFQSPGWSIAPVASMLVGVLTTIYAYTVT